MSRAQLPERSAGELCGHRFDIRKIQDLAQGTLGTEIEVVQMTGPPVRGSLAFATANGIAFSSGLIRGKATIRGAASQDDLTFCIGLRFGQNSRYWLNLTKQGDVGVILPGEHYDAYYTEGSLYVTLMLSLQRLEKEAERYGLIFNRRMISRTGLLSRPIAAPVLTTLTQQVNGIHRTGLRKCPADVIRDMLRAVIKHYAQLSAQVNAPVATGLAKVVFRAREYIEEHLAESMTLDEIAKAADTSRRTLSRAFVEVLEDPPWNYVRRLRLHRIRRELASAKISERTISMIAAKWGIHEPGRMSALYKDLFGELPSETQAIDISIPATR